MLKQIKKSSSWNFICIGMIVLQGIIYGLLDAPAKLVFEQVPVYSFLAVRYLISTIVMLLIWQKSIITELKSVPIRKYLIPCISTAAAFIICNVALEYTSATNMAFIRSLSALIAPLLLVIFYKQKYHFKTAMVHVLLVIGLYLLCAQGSLSQFGIGEILAFLSATLVAASLVFGKEALQHISAVTLSWTQAFAAGIMCFLVGITQDVFGSTNWNAFQQPIVFGTLIYAALLVTVGGYLLQNVALNYISPKLVGVLQCIYPIVGAIAAYFLLDEKMTIAGIIGSVIIIICICLESIMEI